MRFLLTFVCLVFFGGMAHAARLSCEGWYQLSGGTLEKTPMPVTSETENNIVFSGTFRNYAYQVDWNKNLTSLNTSIESDGNRILITTGRVPTDNHPECFTDLNLPGGPRLSVNCEVK
jgi:hypothetical protein